MRTEPTTTISVRVPLSIRRAIEADAADFDRSAGEHLRDMLMRRYAAGRDARNTHDAARITRDEMVTVDG